MTNPAIQNDFSYYRRTISRNRLNNQQVANSEQEQRSTDCFFGFFFTSPLFRRTAGSRKRGQQRDGQSDVSVLRRGHADAEDAEQRHHQVCFRGRDRFVRVISLSLGVKRILRFTFRRYFKLLRHSRHSCRICRNWRSHSAPSASADVV